jgi:hypothetical protein
MVAGGLFVICFSEREANVVKIITTGTQHAANTSDANSDIEW